MERGGELQRGKRSSPLEQDSSERGTGFETRDIQLGKLALYQLS